MRDHRKLRAFELGDELALRVYETTAKFPKSEQFGLVSQLRRAAVSIPSNIVEGCARRTETEMIRFLDIAYGSTREVEYQLSLAQRLGFLSSDDATIVIDCAAETGRVLYGLIRSLTQTRTN